MTLEIKGKPITLIPFRGYTSSVVSPTNERKIVLSLKTDTNYRELLQQMSVKVDALNGGILIVPIPEHARYGERIPKELRFSKETLELLRARLASADSLI